MRRLLFIGCTFLALIAQENHRAKIAILIQDGDQTKTAKKSNRISTEDSFKVFVQPEEDSYIYLINHNKSGVTLINESKLYKAGKLVSFPAESGQNFDFDGENKDETLILIISPVEEYVLANLLNKEEPNTENVLKYIKELEDKNKINLGNQQEKPFAIAGNVRAALEVNVDEMKIYSGLRLIVKSYDFKVKK